MKKITLLSVLLFLCINLSISSQENFIQPIPVTFISADKWMDESGLYGSIFTFLNEKGQESSLTIKREDLLKQKSENKTQNGFIILFIDDYMLCLALDSDQLIAGGPDGFKWEDMFTKSPVTKKPKFPFNNLIQMFKIK